MHSIFRRYIGFTLIAMLVLTGQSMAVARGATGAVGQMVLCTGIGPVTVYLDRDGAPVKPPHYCPDCALSILDAMGAPQVLPYPAESEIRLSAVDPTSENQRPELPQSTARAPPVVI